MQLTGLTKRFIEKAKAEKTNIRKLAKELDIPYDRVYKWFTAKSNPKPPDDAKVEAWLKVEDYSNMPEGDEKTLRDLISTIQEKKGWTQGQVSEGAGYKSETLAQTLTRGGEGLRTAIKQLQLVYKDILAPTVEAPAIDSSNQIMLNLTHSNKILADAHKVIADANYIHASNTAELISMVKQSANVPQQNEKVVAATLGGFQELLLKVATGSKFRSVEEAKSVVDKAFAEKYQQD